MRLPCHPEYDDRDQSAANGINHHMPDEQTFTLQLPTTEDFDDPEDIDYLILASGNAVANHSETIITGTPVPTDLIDRVLASPEQTYEQLLASFTYLTAADVLQTRNMQSNTAVSQLSDERNQPSLWAQTLMSSSACDEQNSSSGNLTSGNVDEDTVEELLLKEIPQSEPCLFGLGRELQVDNFLLTDDELYDMKSDDELDSDEIGAVPKYSVIDASFIRQGQNCARRDVDVCGSPEHHTAVSSDPSESRICCHPLLTLSQSNAQTEITLDVVEPFSLDPDFDYDNVQLSAKFTDEDLSC